MKAARQHGFACLAGVLAPLLALSGCDSAPENNGTVIVANSGAVAEAPLANAAPPPPANLSADVVERMPPPEPRPASANSPIPKMPVHKDFKDPPLPPELQDDHGLKPLPPPPGEAPKP